MEQADWKFRSKRRNEPLLTNKHMKHNSCRNPQKEIFIYILHFFPSLFFVFVSGCYFEMTLMPNRIKKTFSKNLEVLVLVIILSPFKTNPTWRFCRYSRVQSLSKKVWTHYIWRISLWCGYICDLQ